MFKNTSIGKKLGVQTMEKKIDETKDRCTPCKETEKPKLTRKVNEKARSDKFNGSIALDLTDWLDKRRYATLSMTSLVCLAQR